MNALTVARSGNSSGTFSTECGQRARMCLHLAVLYYLELRPHNMSCNERKDRAFVHLQGPLCTASLCKASIIDMITL
jgi:hypothetical protein